MRRLVVLLLVAARAAHSIVVSAPGACGGTRVVTHAGALFGPALSDRAAARAVFAPFPAAADTGGSGRARWALRLWGLSGGRVAAAALADGCAPLGGAAAAAARDRVVLVARGRCDFAVKFATLQAAGAAGVVVVNGRGTAQLANMKLNETLVRRGAAPDVSIPGAMIQFADWRRVAPCRRSPALRVALTRKGQAVNDIDYGRDALNWAMMRGMALWILCQCGVNVVRYKRRASEFRARATTIAALPEEVFREGARETEALLGAGAGVARVLADSDSEDDEPMCAVCLDNIARGDRIRRLACRHLYHRKCIDPWLQSSSNSCPICKREVAGLPPPPSQLHYGSVRV